MLCTERSLVKHEGGTLTARPLRCRCWSCDHCAPRRAKELRWQARDGKPTIFLTLTIRQGRFASPAAQAVELAKGWRMLRQYLMRQLDWKKLPFLCVIEKHKSGWPHMHLLLRCTYISHKLIRDWWIERFDSPVIWINRLTSEARAAHYVTKYLAKAPEVFEGCKRYWSSQDYRLPKTEDPAPPQGEDVYWTTSTSRPGVLAAMALHDGATVTFDGTKVIIHQWPSDLRAVWGVS